MNRHYHTAAPGSQEGGGTPGEGLIEDEPPQEGVLPHGRGVARSLFLFSRPMAAEADDHDAASTVQFWFVFACSLSRVE